MSPTTDQFPLDDDKQFRLFELPKVSTFNPPAEPKRSAADWLVKSNTSISNDEEEGTL